jgi:hypothetical protein
VVTGGLIGWNIYLQQSKKVAPASLEKMAFALPDKPSIAVLPFKNLSGDPKQDYFSDGLTDQISSTLSRLRTVSDILNISKVHDTWLLGIFFHQFFLPFTIFPYFYCLARLLTRTVLIHM